MINLSDLAPVGCAIHRSQSPEPDDLPAVGKRITDFWGDLLGLRKAYT
jgi:hypothetical protein